MIFGPFQRREYGDEAWQVLLGSAFGVSEPVDNWTDGFVRGLRRHLAIHGRTEAARRGDFYRLTPDTPDLHAWEGWQMHDPATGSGVVALWRSEAPEAQVGVRLCGLDPSRTYTVTDLYDKADRSQDVPGDVLARGLEVSLPPMGAALRYYQPSGA
jgi:hypothetical protein